MPGIDATVAPRGQLDLLSAREVERIQQGGSGELSALLRQCSLAVLSCGSHHDDASRLLEAHKDFDIHIQQTGGGISLRLENAPTEAFVDGELIRGLRDHLYAVLRDIVYVYDQLPYWRSKGDSTTDIVFRILRNARLLQPTQSPNLVVCWGGHAIDQVEYDYSKEVGYRLGLRGMDICTGCGSGAMKGPMKGAAVGHAKQRMQRARYIGISEPGIIAAEAPNAIVNRLVIMPDIEKRLEAFVRLGHGIVVFPGGVGTAEEILYLLGILLHERNQDITLPLIFTGPQSAHDYFRSMDEFIRFTLGEEAARHYEIIIDDPQDVAVKMKRAMRQVQATRENGHSAVFFNWGLHIEPEFQQEFDPTHDAMAAIELFRDLPVNQLAANLRRAFSGIVAGNVKQVARQRIEEHGEFELKGQGDLLQAIDRLLANFIQQRRMKIAGEYRPCYRLS